MDIIVSVIKILLYPEVWIVIILTVGCVVSWTKRCPVSLRVILCLVVLLYYGFSTRPLTQALVQPLETYYRPPTTMPAPHDAIVLFANSAPVLPPFSERPTIVGTSSADLLLCGHVYVQARSAPRVVLAEGVSGVLTRNAIRYAALQEWAVSLGYPPEAIIANYQGIATHERADAIKQLLGSNNRILLVDSAIHLPRSAAAFRKAGFTVTPIPCDYYSLMSTDPRSLSGLVPSAGNLQASNEAVYEYVGLLAYWLRGLI